MNFPICQDGFAGRFHGLLKVVVILGPTASGKTELGIALARQFNGEIISADSRQVYKKLDIGTGKPQGVWQEFAGDAPAYVVGGVRHYLMDAVHPGVQFTAADFKAQATRHILDIHRHGRLPFIVGGTGLYISAVVNNLALAAAPPEPKLRAQFARQSLAELVEQLRALDPETAARIDRHNPRRVERALEVALTQGAAKSEPRRDPSPFTILQIGLWCEPRALRARIEKRVAEQLKRGWPVEAEALRSAGYGEDLPSLSGLGYHELFAYRRGELTLAEAKQKIINATYQYTRRQLTWFKRDRRIHWLPGKASRTEAKRLVSQFLDGPCPKSGIKFSD